jgi:Fic family protein
VFVPPPPELVPGLIEDLCAFCNDDSLPAVAQAARTATGGPAAGSST